MSAYFKINSQEDIFSTQFPATQSPKPSTSKIKPRIGFVVLYDLSGNSPKPFGIYPRSMFSTHEIKDKWLDSILNNDSRMTPLVLNMLPDKSYSLFAKVKEDTIKADRDAFIEELNDSYETSMNNCGNEKRTFKALLAKYPYRMKIVTQKKVICLPKLTTFFIWGMVAFYANVFPYIVGVVKYHFTFKSIFSLFFFVQLSF